MQLLAVGLNHETAPVEIRERVAIPGGKLRDVMSSLGERISQGVILSTCNRTEIYALEEGPQLLPEVRRFFCDYSGVSEAELLPRLFHKQQEEAVEHLYRVASGLESLIIGEYEVLGQVRHTLVEMEGVRSIDLIMMNLFRQAVRVGRRVRTETAISRNAASVSSAAVEVARRVFPSLNGRSVLVIGAGQAGKLVVEALAGEQSCSIAVTSRSFEHATELASGLGGTALPFHEIRRGLAEADIVICCTGAPHTVLEPNTVGQSLSGRNGDPLLIIDIAVPRDVDPGVRSLPNVSLYDIDDLEGVARTNRKLREGEVSNAVAIVREEVGRFMEWWRSREAMPAINALLERAERVRTEQVEKTLKAMPALSVEDRSLLETMTRSIVQKILHEPISFAKSAENGDGARAVRTMFGLDKAV